MTIDTELQQMVELLRECEPGGGYNLAQGIYGRVNQLIVAEREACARIAAPRYDFLNAELNTERALIERNITARSLSTTPAEEG